MRHDNYLWQQHVIAVQKLRFHKCKSKRLQRLASGLDFLIGKGETAI